MSYLPPPNGGPPGPGEPDGTINGGIPSIPAVPSVPPAPSPYGSPPTSSPYGSPPIEDAGQFSSTPFGSLPPSQYGTASTPSPYGAPSPYAPQPLAGGYDQPGYTYAASTADNKLAVWALVLSIFGLLCIGLSSVVGLVLAIQARKAADAGRATNRGMATAAMVIAIIAIAFWLFQVIAQNSN